MKTRYILYLFLFSMSISFGQNFPNSCSLYPQTPEEIAGVQAFIHDYQKDTKNLRPSADPVYIPIKLHVVLPDDGNQSLIFFKLKAFNQSLAYTNAVYSKANIQFFVTGAINYIKSSKHLNLVIKSEESVLVDGYGENIVEQELCRPHEIPNVINLFIVNNLNLNGSPLNNYAKLPNTTSVTKLSSYRIMMNGLSFGGYSDLKSPVLAHEIGHHFSLHHPFDAIGGKELVKRGTGSNCETAGDLICDTPADPHNEVSNADKLLCGDLPPNYKDANGEIYKPDMTNIMTYYSNFCKKGFTTGQYERILAGLALRKTNTQFGKYDAPDTQVTAPTITGAASFNNVGGAMFVSIADNSTNELGFILERATSKTGEYIAVRGYAENITRFTDELEDLDVKNIPFLYYRVRPSNSKTAYSNVWEIATKPKVNCIPAVNLKCEESSFRVLFKNVKANNSNLNETFVPCTSTSNYNFLQKIINFQGNQEYTIEGTVTNDIQAYYNVYAWIDLNRNGTFDANERIYASNYTASNRPPNLNYSFKLNTQQLSGFYNLRLRMGFVTDLRDACAGVQQGETVDMAVNVLGAYSIRAGEIANNSICPNVSITVPVTTDGVAPNADNKLTVQLSDLQGNNFKDLTTTVEGTNLKATLPANTPAGTGYKVRVVSSSPVSQSVSSSVLTIKPLPTADFETKDLFVDQYKSTEIKLKLTGDGPFTIKLSDGQVFTLNDANASIKLTPEKTTEYKISSVSNSCGEGTVANSSLKITVNTILGFENENTNHFKLYPNPSTGTLTIKLSQPATRPTFMEIIGIDGRSYLKREIRTAEQQFEIYLLPAGKYIMKIKEGKKIMSKSFIKLN